jgi:hypothetical protein
LAICFLEVAGKISARWRSLQQQYRPVLIKISAFAIHTDSTEAARGTGFGGRSLLKKLSMQLTLETPNCREQLCSDSINSGCDTAGTLYVKRFSQLSQEVLYEHLSHIVG